MKDGDDRERIVTLPSPWNAARRVFSNNSRDRKFTVAVNSGFTVAVAREANFEIITGDYLVSGDRGVHAIVGGRFLQLSEVRTFGIAVRDGRIWCASSGDRYSSITRADLPAVLEPGQRLDFTEIHRAPTSKNGRYHQIGFMGDSLAVAATERNSILFLDPEDGKTISECQPFRDHFGDPIPGDHNHINSVYECGECLLFCAYKAGNHALLCVLHGNQVKAYQISNRGAHDICIEGRNLWHSDTFGVPEDKGGDDCGYPMKNNRRVAEDFFSKPPGRVVRGISGTGGELLFGHSHKGPRSKRYDGKGSIIRLDGGSFAGEFEVPFAQVYDILRLDGKRFDEPPAVGTWEEVNAFFEETLGPCVYGRELD